jgi:hypothetical protein
MPIDENCVNTLEDIIGDLKRHFRGLNNYGYSTMTIEPITSDLTDDDKEHIMLKFREFKKEALDLIDAINDCEK